MRTPWSRSLTPLAALVLAFSLAGCGDDAGTQGESGTASGATQDQVASPPPSEGPSESAGEGQEGAILAVTVDGDEVSPTGDKIEVSSGDTITVRVTSDRTGELHVHSSPEQYVEFEQGRTQQRLTLDQPGQVDIEEHDSGALVARVLVQ